MTIFGWDMSHYDVPALGNAMNEGISFVTHKAGGDQADNEIAAWWNGVKDIPDDRLLKGAYWVLYPGRPVERADLFIQRLDDTCPGWRDRPFILQVDCEIWNNDPGTQPGLSDVSLFCDRLKARMPKLTPIVYASRGQYQNRLRGLKYPLWNANYPTSLAASPKVIYSHIGGGAGVGWYAYSGQSAAIWQISSSAVIGGQSTSDANAFRGTLGELTHLVAPGWNDDMTPDDWKRLTDIVNAPYLNTSKDGAPETPAGHLILSQGIPDGITGERVAAWQSIQHIGSKLAVVESAVASLAARPTATVSPEDLKTAVLAALREILAPPTA